MAHWPLPTGDFPVSSYLYLLIMVCLEMWIQIFFIVVFALRTCQCFQCLHRFQNNGHLESLTLFPYPPQLPGNITVSASIRLFPSLPQPVKFPGWKMHGRACKQYIFRSYNTSTFSAVPFDESPFTWQCQKETKMLKSFKFRNFIGCFQVTSRQWRG